MADSFLQRLVVIICITAAAHFATVALRGLSNRILRSRLRSEEKALTVTGFVTSLLIFGIYFAGIGFVLSELGVSLTTYFASASVIGLAVSFGSQGIVQDVITGLTVVFTDIVDVGDMVDIGGQTGIVEKVGMRFTVLINFFGARVYVPNRSIASVTSYPRGYVRAFLDVRLPKDRDQHKAARDCAWEIAKSCHEQHPGTILLPPSQEGTFSTNANDGAEFFRIKFKIWPGQGQILETSLKQAVLLGLKRIDPEYADWMTTIHYRAEPPGDDPSRRLPRPAVLGMSRRRPSTDA